MKKLLTIGSSFILALLVVVIASVSVGYDKEFEEIKQAVEIYENVTYVGPVNGGHEVLTEANTTLFFADYDWNIDAVIGEELRVKFGGEKYMTIMKK